MDVQAGNEVGGGGVELVGAVFGLNGEGAGGAVAQVGGFARIDEIERADAFDGEARGVAAVDGIGDVEAIERVAGR